jgi:hypothetical protein
MKTQNNPILESTWYVVKNADFVKINSSKISEFAKSFEKHSKHYWLKDSPFNIEKLNDEQKLMFIVVFNAISFSYWGNPYWNVKYKEKLYTRGSWSLVASIFRAMNEGKDILNPAYLSTISKKELSEVLRGNVKIPLLSERVKILNEIGSVLIQKFNGQFLSVLQKSGNDAINLLNLILEEFPSFQDFAYYKSEKVFFQKRAQALVEGIYSIFQGKRYGELKNIDSLTALADYIIPNLLRKLGIMEYSKKLIKKIDNKELLEKGSQEEVEIRACTIWSIELIKRELEAQNIQVSVLNINDYLWSSGGNIKTPFHQTRTTAY